MTPSGNDNVSGGAIFKISGRPATFATAGEKPWKAAIEQQAPRPNPGVQERGMELAFELPSLAPNGVPLDLDNLCEPVFSSLVNRLGWFAGRRPNLAWWHATKQAAERSGCEVRISNEGPLQPAPRSKGFAGTYVGPLPRSARAEEVAEWARRVLGGQDALDDGADLACFLGFGSPRVNIGDISTGPVKSVIDCLYPVLGGRVGAPADWRIQELFVCKGLAAAGENGVLIRVWQRNGSTTTKKSGMRVGVRDETPRVPMRAEPPTQVRQPQGGQVAANVAEAILEAMRARGGQASVKEVGAWVQEHYPGRWKDVSTSMADLTFPGSPSSGYPANKRFLERISPGVYRLRKGF